MKLIFKPKPLKTRSIKLIKLKFFNTSKFPTRSKAEWKLIDRKPFGDADRDKVPNWFDCKPLNKRKQGWAHEGTMLFYPERKSSVKMMSPEKFLRTTHKEVLTREEKGERRLLRTPKQTTRAGMTLATGMVFLPFIPLNKKSRWIVKKITSKYTKRDSYT